jgi:hypothetical protein
VVFSPEKKVYEHHQIVILCQRPNAKSAIIEAIFTLLGVPAGAVSVLRVHESDSGLTLSAARHRFSVEEHSSSGAGPFAGSAEKAKVAAKSAGKLAISLVVAPLVSELGKVEVAILEAARSFGRGSLCTQFS